MRNKIITAEQAAQLVPDGATIMVGGFIARGTPESIMDALVARGAKDLTIIANDPGTGFSAATEDAPEVPATGDGKLIHNHCAKKLIMSHIGLNKEVLPQWTNGDIEVELVPQGSLAEKIRAGGAGLGGVLTPTGVGTEVAEGKETLTINGKEYLLEMPLHADVALIKGDVVDEKGNVFYRNTNKNFAPVMATAADVVIVEAKKLVKAGEMDPNCIHTPYNFVDYIVLGGDK